jgi:D-serine deaminase-like pyridoxal phosphate-dependent protein
VDLERFDANVAEVGRRAAGRRVRVASKSVRSRTLLERILREPPFAGLMCYSAAEAVWLAERGFRDLLVAYPACQAEQLAAVARAVRGGAGIVLMVDSEEHVALAAAAAGRAGAVLPVCLDADMSSRFPGLHFGVRRSPLRRPEEARALARAVARAEGLVLEGLMGYEAQIAGVPDDPRGRRAEGVVIRALKRRSRGEVARRRAAMVAAVREECPGLRFVNGGGTGSLESTGAEACVTEVTAGSAFFAPALFDGYRSFRHQPAAGFALEVARRPGPGLLTCHGGGYVASGRAGADRLPQPWLPEGLRLLPAEGAGEVQTPLRDAGRERLALGDPVLFRHAKAGELCEHFDRLLLVEDGRVAGEAPTYRGEGQCFL